MVETLNISFRKLSGDPLAYHCTPSPDWALGVCLCRVLGCGFGGRGEGGRFAYSPKFFLVNMFNCREIPLLQGRYFSAIVVEGSHCTHLAQIVGLSDIIARYEGVIHL